MYGITEAQFKNQSSVENLAVLNVNRENVNNRTEERVCTQNRFQWLHVHMYTRGRYII